LSRPAVSVESINTGKGNMIPYAYNGAQGNLILQQKMNWAQGQTAAVLFFVHGTALGPAAVHAGGLSPRFSTEYLVDNHNQPIAGGRMIFTFRVCAGNGLPANASKPAAVGVLWGFNGHCYVLGVPANTTFWSQNGTLNVGQEVAFPYEFDTNDIAQYWAPSSNFVRHDGLPPHGRTQFQKVAWNAFQASRAAALNAI
jgi:hypothetical protein